MLPKSPLCSGCPMEHIGIGFVPFEVKKGTTMGVGEAPGDDEWKQGKCFIGGAGRWLQNLTRSAGIKWNDLTLTNTILCHPPENVFPTDSKCTYLSYDQGRKAVEHCAKAHLWPNIAKAGKGRIFAIGGSALTALTGKQGITQWRGSPLPLRTGGAPRVIGTIHPAALMRKAKLASVVVNDFKKGVAVPPEHYNLFPSIADVKRFSSRKFAFDFEWGSDGEVTICGLSDRFYGAIVVPFIDPYISVLQGIFERATHLIGHNIVGADLRYIEKWGWKLRPDISIEDTMLKQHLIQPDFPHGLDFVASVFTSKVFWKGKKWEEMDEEHEGEASPNMQQWRTWNSAEALPREYGGYGGCLSAQEAFALYNARDTDAEFQIDTPISQMIERYGLRPTYQHVSLPVAYICRDMSEAGLKLDLTHLGDIRSEIDTKIVALEAQLPCGLAPYEEEVTCNVPAPPDTYRPKTKVCKGTGKTKHDPIAHTFLGPSESACCSGCMRTLTPGKMQLAKIVKGTRIEKVVPYNSAPRIQEYVAQFNLKEVRDHKTGNVTTGKKARAAWAKDHPEFITLGALKEQITLRNNFAKDTLLLQERMYFNLKVHGTSEGRLSSSGRRRGIDLNIQNQPKAFRSIYIPDQSDWGFLSLDIVQGENWLTTWIAKDWDRWERLQDAGYDEHADLASRIFNRVITKAACKIDPALDALRQIGKKINHGRNSGMGIKKQQDELASAGYEYFSFADVKEFIEIWKRMNARTAEWQRETIETAQRQGYLRNPFGRVRWFSSRSIATESLAFLPASTLADTVLRMMVAHFPQRYRGSIDANQTSVFHPLVDGFRMALQVHDELCFQGPWEGVDEQNERSTQIMTQPFPQLDGFHFRVDSKRSMKSWGDCH